MKCAGCHEKMPEGKMKCPRCGRWASLSEKDADIHKLSELSSSEHARLVTGPWDLVWGGGIVDDSVTFLAGTPGAGKTSLLMHVAQAVATAGGTVLYVSKEESPGQVKARAVRFCVPEPAQERILIVSKFGGSIRDLCDQIKPTILLVDSLPALVGIGWGDVAEAVETLILIKEYANETHCPAIVVDHVNKRGEFSGPVAFEHLIDTTLFQKVDKKNPNLRHLVPQKNRFGAVDVRVSFLMTKTGLSYVVPEEIDEDDEDSEKSAVSQENP